MDQYNKSSDQLKSREKGEIFRFNNEKLAGRLMSMGILPGSTVEMIRKAPFGGAFYLKVDQFLIAVRKEEAKCIVLK